MHNLLKPNIFGDVVGSHCFVSVESVLDSHFFGQSFFKSSHEFVLRIFFLLAMGKRFVLLFIFCAIWTQRDFRRKIGSQLKEPHLSRFCQLSGSCFSFQLPKRCSHEKAPVFGQRPLQRRKPLNTNLFAAATTPGTTTASNSTWSWYLFIWCSIVTICSSFCMPKGGRLVICSGLLEILSAVVGLFALRSWIRYGSVPPGRGSMAHFALRGALVMASFLCLWRSFCLCLLKSLP